MKKIVTTFVLLLIIVILFLLFPNKDEDTDLTKIRVAEVTHSMFYTPQYVALTEGFFKEEGLDVEIMLAPSVGDFFSEIQRSYTLCPVSMSWLPTVHASYPMKFIIADVIWTDAVSMKL